MLHFIGLGLADERDVTVRGLEIIKRAERVYLEAYTAVLLVDKETLVSLLPPIPPSSPWGLTSMLRDSRKHSMAALSSSPTAKWSSRLATTSWPMPTRSTSPFSSSAIPSGTFVSCVRRNRRLLTATKRYHSHRPRPSRARAQHPHQHGAERQHPDRCRLHRSAAIQLRPDHQYGVLH